MTLWSSGEETPAAERVLGVDIAYLQVLEQLDIESLHDLCSWTLLEDIHIYIYVCLQVCEPRMSGPRALKCSGNRENCFCLQDPQPLPQTLQYLAASKPTVEE